MIISEKNTDEVIKFVQDHLEDEPAHLLLRYANKTTFDLKFAVQQIHARQKLKHKLPTWVKSPKIIFPVSLSLEQASSEITASFKGSLINKGNLMIDLTGGMGVDTFFLSKKFDHAIYCEKNPELFEISQHNLEFLRPKQITAVSGDSLEFLKSSVDTFDLLYLDPARRNNQNQKLFQFADCEPNIVEHWNLLKSKSKAVMIKASPMLDLKLALKDLEGIQQVWVLSYKNEVKEIVFYWSKDGLPPETMIHAVELGHEKNEIFKFSFEEEEQAKSVFSKAQTYLIEPFSSVLKSGAFKSFGERYGLKKLHVNTHLYTTNEGLENIPGRIFKIEHELLQPKKEIKTLFPKGKVNVLTRNYSLKAEDLKKKYQLKDGGNDYLIGANSGGEFKLWHCRRVDI